MVLECVNSEESHQAFSRDPCWGLFCFLLYINDLPDDIQSQVRLFADDSAVCP